MRNTITYGDLDRLLCQLGFFPVSSSGPQKVFENPGFKALVVLPPSADDEPVRPRHLAAAKRIIIERGIADQDTFDRLIEGKTLAKA